MKWTSPQCITACASLALGFLLTFLDFFLGESYEIHDSTLWVLGQAFIYAGSIFSIKGYVDSKITKFKDDYRDEHQQQ